MKFLDSRKPNYDIITSLMRIVGVNTRQMLHVPIIGSIICCYWPFYIVKGVGL